MPPSILVEWEGLHSAKHVLLESVTFVERHQIVICGAVKLSYQPHQHIELGNG